MEVKRQGFPSLSIDPLADVVTCVGFLLSILLLRLLFPVHFFHFIMQEATIDVSKNERSSNHWCVLF